MGESTAPDRNEKQDSGEHEGNGGATNDLTPLRAECEAFLAVYQTAKKRHTDATHFAGLSEYSLAQALIDELGSARFVEAVHAARAQKHEYFYDILCALIPTASERLKFYDRVRKQQTVAAPDPSPAQSTDAPVPAKEEQKPAGKELVIAFYEEIDRNLTLIPEFVAQKIRRALKAKKMKHMEHEGFILVANHHLHELTDFDPKSVTEELQASGENLQQFHATETAKFQSEVVALRLRAHPTVQTIEARISAIRDEVLQTFIQRFGDMVKDLHVIEDDAKYLITPEGIRIQEGASDILRHRIQTIEEEVRQQIIKKSEKLTELRDTIPLELRGPHLPITIPSFVPPPRLPIHQEKHLMTPDAGEHQRAPSFTGAAK